MFCTAEQRWWEPDSQASAADHTTPTCVSPLRSQCSPPCLSIKAYFRYVTRPSENSELLEHIGSVTGSGSGTGIRFGDVGRTQHFWTCHPSTGSHRARALSGTARCAHTHAVARAGAQAHGRRTRALSSLRARVRATVGITPPSLGRSRCAAPVARRRRRDGRSSGRVTW